MQTSKDRAAPSLLCKPTQWGFRGRAPGNHGGTTTAPLTLWRPAPTASCSLAQKGFLTHLYMRDSAISKHAHYVSKTDHLWIAMCSEGSTHATQVWRNFELFIDKSNSLGPGRPQNLNLAKFSQVIPIYQSWRTTPLRETCDDQEKYFTCFWFLEGQREVNWIFKKWG